MTDNANTNAPHSTGKSGPMAERPMFVMLVAGVGFFVLSFVAMGIAPWTTLNTVIDASNQIDNPYYDDAGNLTAVGRGRQIYIREACWHCHSQFVRPVAGEEFRYGPVSQAWEAMHDVPQTYGTRRIGPDLSREAGRRTDGWHLAHLYNPRDTVPLSVMPPYRYFFEETENGLKPKQEALDLVAYLQYLGSHFQDDIEAIAWPEPIKITGAPAPTNAVRDRGEELWFDNCVGCHGETGEGAGKAAHLLGIVPEGRKWPIEPKPADLTTRFMPREEVYALLYSGSKGTSMPSFAEMPEKDLWALAQFVQELTSDETRQQAHAVLTSETVSAQEQLGQQSYNTRCASCHGNTGHGDGPTAAGINPKPKDLTRRLFHPDYLRQVILEGRLGTAMGGFADLKDNPDELEALVKYVTKMYEGESPVKGGNE